MDRDDAALTDALGQNQYQMRLAQDMALVCVPDLGWRRVLVQARHVRGLHQPMENGNALTPAVVGLWMSPTQRLVLPAIWRLDQVEPFGS